MRSISLGSPKSEVRITSELRKVRKAVRTRLSLLLAFLKKFIMTKKIIQAALRRYCIDAQLSLHVDDKGEGGAILNSGCNSRFLLPLSDLKFQFCRGFASRGLENPDSRGLWAAPYCILATGDAARGTCTEAAPHIAADEESKGK